LKKEEAFADAARPLFSRSGRAQLNASRYAQIGREGADMGLVPIAVHPSASIWVGSIVRIWWYTA